MPEEFDCSICLKRTKLWKIPAYQKHCKPQRIRVSNRVIEIPTPTPRPDDATRMEHAQPNGWKIRGQSEWTSRSDCSADPIWSCLGHLVDAHAQRWITLFLEWEKGYAPPIALWEPMYRRVMHALAQERSSQMQARRAS